MTSRNLVTDVILLKAIYRCATVNGPEGLHRFLSTVDDRGGLDPFGGLLPELVLASPKVGTPRWQRRRFRERARLIDRRS